MYPKKQLKGTGALIGGNIRKSEYHTIFFVHSAHGTIKYKKGLGSHISKDIQKNTIHETM